MQSNFSLTDFEDEKFNPSDFVNSFIEKSLTSTVDFSSLDKCNLADLNKVIEGALKSLKSLKEDINLGLNSIKSEKELLHTAVERNQDKLAADMTVMKDEFANLETKILKFAEKSITIGTHLSQLDKEKEAAILTSELIEYFVAFNSNDPNNYPEIFKDKKNFEVTAKYLYFLHEVGQNLTTSEFNIAVKNINEKYEQIRKVLYNEFTDGLLKRDAPKLQRLLPDIIDFNLIQEVSMYYINSILRSIGNDMVFELRTLEENKKTIENTYVNLLRVLKNELTSEDNFFMNVLEDKSIEVIKLFISNMFESYIGKALEKISTSFAKNEELYLKYYEIIYLRTEEIIQDIYKMDFPEASELHEASRAHFHNIFDEYHANYFTREAHFLTNLLEKNTERIQKQLEKLKEKEAQIVKTAVQVKFVEKALMNVGDVNQLEKFKLSREEATTRIELLRDILMHEGTELMFSSLDQSVHRCMKVSRFDEKNNNAIYLINKFLEYFGGVLLMTLVDFTAHIVPDLSRKLELNESFFEIIFKLNSLVQRVEISLYKSVRDLIKDRKYEQLMEKKEKILHGLEQKIERSLQKAIASLVIFSNRILVGNQEKNEYYIKGSKTVEAAATAGCHNFVNFLAPYVKQIRNSYSENIKKRILSLLGLQLVGVLTDYFGESKVNVKGSVVIDQDIAVFQKLIDDFDDQHVADEFDVLKALINIYKIETRELENYLKMEEKLRNVPPQVIEKYKYNRS